MVCDQFSGGSSNVSVGSLAIIELILRKTIAILSACVLLAVSSACTEVHANVKAEKDRHSAPDFALKDNTGKTLKLSDYRGKVVLLNFWATWCEPCQVEIPWFIDFQQTYKDRDFAVIGVSMDDDGWDSVKPFVARQKINYPVVIGTEEVSAKYGSIESLPTTFLLDRAGRIATMHIGLVSKNAYRNDIVHLIEKERAPQGTPTTDSQRGSPFELARRLGFNEPRAN